MTHCTKHCTKFIGGLVGILFFLFLTPSVSAQEYSVYSDTPNEMIGFAQSISTTINVDQDVTIQDVQLPTLIYSGYQLSFADVTLTSPEGTQVDLLVNGFSCTPEQSGSNYIPRRLFHLFSYGIPYEFIGEFPSNPVVSTYYPPKCSEGKVQAYGDLSAFNGESSLGNRTITTSLSSYAWSPVVLREIGLRILGDSQPNIIRTTCDGTFSSPTVSGQPTVYPLTDEWNNHGYVFCPSTASQKIKLDFTTANGEFDLPGVDTTANPNEPYQTLSFYNGNTIGKEYLAEQYGPKLMGSYSFNNTPGVVTSTASDGCITVWNWAKEKNGGGNESYSNFDGWYAEVSCVQAQCGNGSIETGEQCDDGNTVSGDGCDAYCQLEPAYRCGNGIVDPIEEECDDGNTVSGDGCDASCQYEAFGECGNGTVERGEECDDGNNVDTDACTSSCEYNVCGDRIINFYTEQCDDGNDDNTDGCIDDCTIAECGDGYVQSYTPNDDNCSQGSPNGICEPLLGETAFSCYSDCNQTCQGVCVNSGDSCVPDGTQPQTASVSTCDAGAGPCVAWRDILDPGVQDRGICQGTTDQYCTADTDCASNVCLKPTNVCGATAKNEQCDDGNNINGDGCENDCTLTPGNTCGDGIIDDGEQCDDGNNVNGDGCSSQCQLEDLTCGDNFYDTGGLDYNYDNNQQLSWEICPETDTNGNPLGMVQLNFERISLEASQDCSRDMLTVSDLDPEVGTGASRIQAFCSSHTNEVLEATNDSGCLVASFQSDDSVTRAGWSATVNCVTPSGDGECKTYNETYETQPATDTPTGCTVGQYADANDTPSYYYWTCEGTDGGTDTTCKAQTHYCGDDVCNTWEIARRCGKDCPDVFTPICKTYNTATTSQPANSLYTACKNGSAYDWHDIDDTSTAWRWECEGFDRYTKVICEAPKDLGTCGNGTVEPLEECDDGNSVATDSCTNDCTIARCGDGVVQDGVEECDRQNGCNTSCEWVTPSCAISASANSTLLGSSVTFDLTYTDQTVGSSIFVCNGGTFCGDGWIDYDGGDNELGTSDDEECDDGNTENGDGCTSNCKFATPQAGNSTTNSCFNGIQDAGETGVDCGGSCQTCS